MNQRAQARLQQIEKERIELTKYLDAPRIAAEDRAAIASRLRELLTETEQLNSGEHGLRGNTTAQNQDLFKLVRRAISAGKVLKQ